MSLPDGPFCLPPPRHFGGLFSPYNPRSHMYICILIAFLFLLLRFGNW